MGKEGKGVTAPKGFLAGGIHCGIKSTKARDLALIFSPAPCSAAGVFTQNRMKAAPIRVSQEHLRNRTCRAIVANSGNANACTGEKGMRSARLMARLAASALGLSPGEVLVASTGMISRPLPEEALRKGIPELAKTLRPEGADHAAEGIMTTDKIKKIASRHFTANGRRVTLGGIAKGSGMIHPNMATMLAFLTTDFRVPKPLLQKALREACDRSFNRISVDGDTSTNDCVLVLANGLADNPPAARATETGYKKFKDALRELCFELALSIVLDGEGATKLVEVRVTGAKTETEAVRVAKSIATSNLVKTAVFGCDPNFGRILAAAGNSGVPFDPDRVRLSLGGTRVFPGTPRTPETEQKIRDHFRKKAVVIRFDLGRGKGTGAVFTCDFSYDYVRINAEYRT
jgi:glutamate N-acetyltransferase/amino-acid N-acetyltransferase